MKLNKEIKKKYYNICYKQKLNNLFSNESMEHQFYAQRRLIESMFKEHIDELTSICENAKDKAQSDFKFFTTLS